MFFINNVKNENCFISNKIMFNEKHKSIVSSAGYGRLYWLLLVLGGSFLFRFGKLGKEPRWERNVRKFQE